jgi:protein SCO1
MSKAAKYILATWIVALVVGAGWIAWDAFRGGEAPGAASIGGSFTLTDHTGRRVTEADLQGRLSLIYFGFTYCPDACPTALVLVQTALEQVGNRADGKVQVVLITVDPERDTQAVLKDYVEQFGPQFVGMTGTPDEIAAVARKYRVYYRKVPGKEGSPYLMDHSSVIYLMDRRGRYVQAFTHNSRVPDIVAALNRNL